MDSSISLYTVGYVVAAVAVMAVYWRFGRRKALHRPSDCLIVITGCDSGFGEASAKNLASKGYQVLACCLTEDGKEKIKQYVFKSMVCDVTKLSDIDKIAMEVNSATSNHSSLRLWALINNAGVAPIGYFDWMSVRSLRKAMEVNYFGLVDMTKAMLPFLKRCRGARIINVSSMAGVVAGPGFGAYSASKHAVEGLTKSLRAELRPWGVHACNINPAFMKTPLIESSIEAAQAELANAPQEIRNQYPSEVLDKSMHTILTVQENPVKVVRMFILTIVKLDWGNLNNTKIVHLLHFFR